MKQTHPWLGFCLFKLNRNVILTDWTVSSWSSSAKNQLFAVSKTQMILCRMSHERRFYIFRAYWLSWDVILLLHQKWSSQFRGLFLGIKGGTIQIFMWNPPNFNMKWGFHVLLWFGTKLLFFYKHLFFTCHSIFFIVFLISPHFWCSDQYCLRLKNENYSPKHYVFLLSSWFHPLNKLGDFLVLCFN